MKSTITAHFRRAFSRLPSHVQRQARVAYRLFAQNPYHSSLHFKQIHSTRPIYSVRVGRGYRAIGELANDEITWFWIGSHSEYNKLVSRL